MKLKNSAQEIEVNLKHSRKSTNSTSFTCHGICITDLFLHSLLPHYIFSSKIRPDSMIPHHYVSGTFLNQPLLSLHQSLPYIFIHSNPSSKWYKFDSHQSNELLTFDNWEMIVWKTMVMYINRIHNTMKFLSTSLDEKQSLDKFFLDARSFLECH